MNDTHTTQRDYTPLQKLTPAPTTEATMQRLADALWQHFHTKATADKGLSWVGFYFAPHHTFTDHSGLSLTPDTGQMLLGPSRDKPACSPIPLSGACGTALKTRSTLLVNNIKNLGENYVACDPRDTAELVIPLFNKQHHPYAVFDADSFDENAFNTHDADNIESLLTRLGLSHPATPTPITAR